MQKLSQPIWGPWPYNDYPRCITVYGYRFERARWRWPRRGVVAQYREAVPDQSAHLCVSKGGVWRIDHVDAVNPDKGGAIAHLVEDVLRR